MASLAAMWVAAPVISPEAVLMRVLAATASVAPDCSLPLLVSVPAMAMLAWAYNYGFGVAKDAAQKHNRDWMIVRTCGPSKFQEVLDHLKKGGQSESKLLRSP